MLRRTPTRIELKIDDLDEYESVKKAREQEQRNQKVAVDSGLVVQQTGLMPEGVGAPSKTDIPQRIGFDPKPLPQPSRLPHLH